MKTRAIYRTCLMWGILLLGIFELNAVDLKRVLVAPLVFLKSPYSGNLVNNAPTEEALSLTALRRNYEDIWGPFWETASHGKFIVETTVVDYTYAQWPMGVKPGVSYGGRWYTKKMSNATAAMTGELFDERKGLMDGYWTPGERFSDGNGDGKYTLMEEWWDSDDTSTGGQDNKWDHFGEEFADYDEDGRFSSNVRLVVYAQDLDLGIGSDNTGVAGDGFIGSANLGIAAVKVIYINELDLNPKGHVNASANTFAANLTGDRSWKQYFKDVAGTAPTTTGNTLAPDKVFNLPNDGKNNYWDLVTEVGTVNYKVIKSGNIETVTVKKYRAPEVFVDDNKSKTWDDRDAYEDFMIRWEPWYWPTTSTVPTGGWVPVTDTYINNNYPGDKVALWARTNNKKYDAEDSFTNEFSEKIKVVYNASQSKKSYLGGWDPHNTTLASGGGLNGWFTLVFGESLTTGGRRSKWVANGLIAQWDYQEFDGDRGGLITINDKFSTDYYTHCAEPILDITLYKTYKAFGFADANLIISTNIMPDSKGNYYDGPREFRDLPSAIYHAGGDLRFGEQTDPQSESISGTDYGRGYKPDNIVEIAGPLAYNIHGDKGYDAGNQAIMELFTWNTEGATSANTDTCTLNATFEDTAARRCRDNNLDGLIDQGFCPPKNFNNYLMDNIGQKGDGVGEGYPFNRNRLLEDIAEYNDDGLDFDKFSQNPNTVDYVIIGIPGGTGGGHFQGLSGLQQNIRTRDDSGIYSFMGQPDQSFQNGRLTAHEMNHDYWSSGDLYDYDSFNGIRVNSPIGAFDLMARGGLCVTPITPASGGYVVQQDLRTLLVPGVEQTINIFPHNYRNNDRSYFQISSLTGTGEKYLFYYDNGVGNYSNGFNGMVIIHEDFYGSTDALISNQRIGNHFQYQVVEANGTTDMVEGKNNGTQSSVWPYNGKVTFNNNVGEQPKSQWWDGTDAGFEIRNIELPSSRSESQPIKVTFFLKHSSVPEFSFINPPGGTTDSNKNYAITYRAFDVYGGSYIFFYRDNKASGYAGTYLNYTQKNVMGEINSNFQTSLSTLTDGGYWFYAMLMPGTSENGTNVAYYVTPKLVVGAGSISGVTVNTNPFGVAAQQSTLQTWTLECVKAGGSGVGQFTATGSVTGLEAAKITVGSSYNTAKDFTGLRLTINSTKDFGVGDLFYVRTTGFTPYSESILVVNGASVIPNAAQPGVVVSSLSNKVSEGGTTATFTVKLSGLPEKDVVVNLVSSNSAEATVSPSTLRFTPELSDTKAYWINQTVTVTGIDDALVDGDQTFDIQLSTLSTNVSYTLANAATVPGINVDNESYGVEYITEDAITYEFDNGTSISETVWFRLRSRPLKDVVVSVSSSNTSEGKLASTSSSTFTFTPDNWNSLQKFTICGVDDAIVDGDKVFYIVSTMVSVDNNFNGLISKLKMVNFDNEIPDIVVSKMSNDLQESGITGTFAVQLTTQPSDNVTVKFSSSDTTVAITDIRSIVFSPTNYSNPQTITVIPMENSATGDSTTSIQFSALESTDTNYKGIRPADLSVTVKDNDSYGYTISKPPYQPDENGRETLFYIYLNKAPAGAGNVIVDVGVSDLTEASVSPAQIVFDSTNWNGRRYISVTGLDDTLVDGNLPFDVLLTANSASTDTTYKNLDPKDVALINIDNDTSNVVVDVVDRYSDEFGDLATFSAYCTKAPVAGNVNVFTVSADPSEGFFNGGSSNLIFSPANFNVLQMGYVMGVKDNKEDGNASYQLIQTLSGNTTYTALVLPKIALINRSTEVPEVLISQVSGTPSESGATATFRVKLLRQPSKDKDVSISLFSSDNTEATVSPNLLTFTATNFQVPQTVTVTGLPDILKDGDVPFHIYFSVSSADSYYDKLAVAPVRLFNKDKDQNGVNIVMPTSSSSESSGSVQLKFNLFTAPTSAVILTLTTSDNTEGSFSADGKSDTATVFFTTNSWQTEKTVTVYGIDDAVFDGDVPYVLSVVTSSPDSNYNNLFIPKISLTNIDNDNPKVIIEDKLLNTIVDSTTGFKVTEGSSANLNIRLQQRPTGNVFLDVALSDNSTVSLSLNGGSTKGANVLLSYDAATYSFNQILTLVSKDDFLINSDRVLNLTLSVNTTLTTDMFGYQLINIVPVEIRELNNDIPKVIMTSVSASGNTNEAGGNIVLNLSLSTIPDHAVTVNLTNSNNKEVSLSVNSLTFPTNSTATTSSKQVVITGLNDNIFDGDVAVDISFAVTSSDLNYNGLTVPKFSFTNTDLPKLFVTNVSGTEINRDIAISVKEGLGENLHLRLSKMPSGNVAYDVKLSDSSLLKLSLDGGLTRSGNVLVNFPLGNFGSNTILTIVGAEDLTVYPSSTTILSFSSNATNTLDASGYKLYQVKSANVTMVDNDNPSVFVTTPGRTTEATGKSTFTVALGSIPSSTVTLAITNTNSAEVLLGSSILIFSSNASALVAQEVSLTGVDDSVDDGDVEVSLLFTIATLDPIYKNITVSPLKVTNTDNDTAGIAVNHTAFDSSIKEGSSGQMTLVLKSEPTSSVTISVAYSDSDGFLESVSPSTLTFTPLNWMTSQTVIIQTKDDGVVGPATKTPKPTITLNSSSSDALYHQVSSLSGESFSVTITEDDSFSLNVEGLSGKFLHEDRQSLVGRVRLGSAISSGNVVVDVTSSKVSAMEVLTPRLVLDANSWMSGRTFKLRGVKDADAFDANVQVSFSVNSTLSTTFFATSSSTSDILIKDLDRKEVLVTTPEGVVLDENGASIISMLLRLSSAPLDGETVTVTPSVLGNIKFSPSSLSFNSTNYRGYGYFSISSNINEVSSSSYLVNFSVAGSAGSYSGVTITPVVLQVRDLDNSFSILARQSGKKLSEYGDSQLVYLKLSKLPTETVLLNLSVGDTTEASLSTSSLSFTPDNFSKEQSVTLMGKDDTLKDGPVDFSFSAVGAGGGYSGLSKTLDFTNLDNDSADFNVSHNINENTFEGGSATKTITVKSLTTPSSTVNVSISVSNNEGILNKSTLSFGGLNSDSQSVVVSGNSDILVDGHQPYSISFGNATSSDNTYHDLALEDVEAINFDDELVGLDFFYPLGTPKTINNILITTSELSGNASIDTFAVRLSSAPLGSANVIFDVVSTDTNEGWVKPAQIVFDSSNWSVPKEITVVGQKIPGQSNSVNYFIRLVLNSGTTDSVYRYLPAFEVKALNQPIDLVINDEPDLGNGSNGEFIVDLIKQKTLVLTASNGLKPYSWSIASPTGGDMVSSILGIGNDTLYISNLGTQTGTYTISVTDSQSEAEVETYKLFVQGSPKIKGITRPTVNTVKLNFDDVANSGRNYLVYTSGDGVTWKLIGGPLSPTPRSKGLMAPSTLTSYDLTVSYEGSSSGYFQIVAVDSTDSSKKAPELPSSTAKTYYPAMPPANTTTDVNLGGGGGGGCLLKP